MPSPEHDSRAVAVGAELVGSVMTGWPELASTAWEDTRDTLHMWTQVVGQVRLALEPAVNHTWQAPLCRFYQGWIQRHAQYQDVVYRPPPSRVRD